MQIPVTGGKPLKLFYFAPGDIQVARVDRQCIVYACEAFQSVGADAELVAMKIRLHASELVASDPLDLYRLKCRPTLRSVRSWVSQSSSSFWWAVNRLLIHGWVGLKAALSVPRGAPVVFYTKNFGSAALFQVIRRILAPGLKVIFEIHTLPHNCFQRSVLLANDGIVANSLTLASDLKPLVGDKPLIGTHQGVDLEHYNDQRVSRETARQHVGLPVDKPCIVYTGKIYWGYREVDLLLQTAKCLGPDIEFVLVGGREDQVEKFRQFINRENLPNVRMVGFVAPREVHYYQLAADILVSYYPQGLELNRYRSPGKLFEYMAAGRGIVAADYCSLREVLGNDGAAGLLVPPDRPEILAAELKNLITDKGRLAAMGSAALERVKHFSWVERARTILDFIEGLPCSTVSSAEAGSLVKSNQPWM